MKKLIYFLILTCLLFGTNTTKIDIQNTIGYDVGTNHLCSYYYRANNLLTDLNSSSMDDGFGSETIDFDLCNELKKTGVQFLYWPIDYGKPMEIVNVGCDDCLTWLESGISNGNILAVFCKNCTISKQIYSESLIMNCHSFVTLKNNEKTLQNILKGLCL